MAINIILMLQEHQNLLQEGENVCLSSCVSEPTFLCTEELEGPSPFHVLYSCFFHPKYPYPLAFLHPCPMVEEMNFKGYLVTQKLNKCPLLLPSLSLKLNFESFAIFPFMPHNSSLLSHRDSCLLKSLY